MLLAPTSFTPLRRFDERIDDLVQAVLMPRGNQRFIFSVSSRPPRSSTLPADVSGWNAVCTAINHVAAAGARPIGVAVGVVTPGRCDAAVRAMALASVREAARTADVPLAALDEETSPADESDALHITAFAVGAAP